MKAQMSILVKGIYLIIVLVTIAIATNLITRYNYLSATRARELEFRKSAVNIVDKLVGYKEGLAFKDSITLQAKELELSQNRIIDLKKLKEFSNKFSEYEPDSVRNFNFRYRIRIETQPIDLETKEWDFETKKECRKVCYQSYVPKCYWVCDIVVMDRSKKIGVKIPSESWAFGTNNFSKDDALRNRMTISIPVVVYYDKSKLMPAVLSIDIVDGELEDFSNLVDKSCLTGEKMTSSLHLSYPTYKHVSGGKNYVCMSIEGQEVCQRLSCEKQILFEERIAPGKYRIVVEPNQMIKVRV